MYCNILLLFMLTLIKTLSITPKERSSGVCNHKAPSRTTPFSIHTILNLGHEKGLYMLNIWGLCNDLTTAGELSAHREDLILT